MRHGAIVLAAGVIAAAALVAVLLSQRGDTPPPKQARPGAPNVIVIMADDQALNSWSPRYMPRTFERIVKPGTDLRQAYATPPLCCPARASFLKGRYPHNHGVLTNNYPSMHGKDDVLPVWLRQAGYRTMVAGKFMNGYHRFDRANDGATPAPGWDRWWVQTGEDRNYYDYEVSVDGEIEAAGRSPRDYATNALTDAAIGFMREESDQPYFLWISHVAPHSAPLRSSDGPCSHRAPTPLPRDFRVARGAKLPKDPSYFEDDLADKPPFVRSLTSEAARSTEIIQARIELTWKCTVGALRSFDRNNERVFETLEETGELRNTAIFYLSDNGTYFGEHGKSRGKKLAYEPGAHVPMAMRLPARHRERAVPPSSQELVGTIDIAPTILDLAGLEGEHQLDGRSLLDLPGFRDRWPDSRALTLELGNNRAPTCGVYRSIRSPGHLYVKYFERSEDGATCEMGPRELYDMRRDPFQLENLLGVKKPKAADERLATRLDARLEALGECEGIQGRETPGDAPFCE